MGYISFALVLLAIIGAFLADRIYFESAGVVYLANALFDITNWLAFWR